MLTIQYHEDRTHLALKEKIPRKRLGVYVSAEVLISLGDVTVITAAEIVSGVGSLSLGELAWRMVGEATSLEKEFLSIHVCFQSVPIQIV